MDKKQTLMAVAITALVGLGSLHLQAEEAGTPEMECVKNEKNTCKGKNKCEGKTAKGERNGCGGKSTCKGHVLTQKLDKDGNCPKGFKKVPKA